MRKNKTLKKAKKQTAAAKMKEEFRLTPEWWAMRKELIAEQKKDPVTKAKLSPKANCHHLDQRDENYTSTDKRRYIMLQPLTHKMIHFLYRLYKKQGEHLFDTLRNIFKLMDKYSTD